MTTKLFKIIKKEIQIDSSEDNLYEIPPHFVSKESSLRQRTVSEARAGEFEREGETFQLYINPASVEDEDGRYRQYFPGNL